MWLEEAARTFRALSHRFDLEFFIPLRENYQSARERVVQKASQVDSYLTNNLRFYTAAKEYFVGIFEEYVKIASVPQEYLAQILDIKAVAGTLNFIQRVLDKVSFFVFFLVGFVVNQAKTLTLQRHIRSPLASVFLLPAALGVIALAGLYWLLGVLSSFKAEIDKRLFAASSFISKPFQAVLGPASRISPDLGRLVLICQDATVVLLLGFPVACLVVIDRLQPASRAHVMDRKQHRQEDPLQPHEDPLHAE